MIGLEVGIFRLDHRNENGKAERVQPSEDYTSEGNCGGSCKDGSHKLLPGSRGGEGRDTEDVLIENPLLIVSHVISFIFIIDFMVRAIII